MSCYGAHASSAGSALSLYWSLSGIHRQAERACGPYWGRNTCHASIKPVPGSLHRLGMAAPVRIPVAHLTLPEGCPKCLKLLPQKADTSPSARWHWMQHLGSSALTLSGGHAASLQVLCSD